MKLNGFVLINPHLLLKFLLCIIFLLIHTNSAQQITFAGYITDSKTGAPVDSAKISIINKNNPSQKFLTYSISTGMWSFSFDPTGVETDALRPEAFEVAQNFPNPFNPSTRISFRIFSSGLVTVRVFNSIGELLDEKQAFLEAGFHGIDWNSKGSAGVLIYTVEFKGAKISKKMIQLDGAGNGGLGNFIAFQGIVESLQNNPVTNEYYVIAEKLIYMPDTVTITAINNLNIDFSLITVHDDAFVFDLHNDVLEKVVTGYDLGVAHTYNHSDLPRFKAGGVDAQMFALWVSPGDTIGHTYYSYTNEMIDSFQNQVNRYGNMIGQARNYYEVMSLAGDGKLAGVLCVEGGHAIENDLQKLRNLYNRGMRYLTITWNNSTTWAVSAQDSRTNTVGLSDFGRQVIQLLDSMGVLIDVAHTGIKTIWDILAITKNPIIDTHCGVRKLRNHYRNLNDAQIDSIAAHGGVIGVVFYPAFLTATNTASIDTVIKHIDYIKNRVGIDYVAIGSDYDGIETVPIGLENVSKLPKLTEALLKRGYTITEVKKLLGENFLRVFKKVCG